MIGIASLLAFSLVCLLLLRPLRKVSMEDSTTIVRTSAVACGLIVGERINRVQALVHIYAGRMGRIASEAGTAGNFRREEVLKNLYSMLEYQVASNNLWCIFEPGVFAEPDSLFAGKPGNTADGRFLPWIIEGKQVTAVDGRAGAFSYETAKREGRDIIIKPYTYILDGKEKKVFSVCSPILVNGRFVGVVGADFDLHSLHSQIDRLTSENAAGRLVTREGVIVTHDDPTQIGTLVSNGNRALIDRLADRRMIEDMSVFEGQKVYNIYVPVTMGSETWFYAERIPTEYIYRQARSTATLLVVYCIIGLVMITLAGWYLMRPLMKNISGLTGIIRRLSLGHIDLDIAKSAGRDELGTMTNELGQLVDGLKRTAAFARNIGQGKLDAEYRLLSDDDALGNSLLEMRESLRKASDEHITRAGEEEHRNWVTAGLARFAEILRRDNNNMETLSYNVISNMVKYIGINQGGIFILNEAENVLELKACYAFDRRKFAEKTVSPGEGLVGTCLLEGEPIYMTDIPNEYINITSGLGDANPRALLITPLKVNDKIFGVVELASFKPFEPYQLEFVQKISESIASTISSVTVNIHTNRLLEQTRLQAEEMSNQEEELRQNMEELQATQEEMRRREEELRESLARMEVAQAAEEEKEHEMQQFQAAIFDANSVVEFDDKATITGVNDHFLEMFGGSRSQYIGQHLRAFVGDEGYHEAHVAVGVHKKAHEDVRTVTTPGGDRKTVRQRFIPITDANGSLLKVLMLVFDETYIEEIRQHEEELRQNMEEMQATQEEMRRQEKEISDALEKLKKSEKESNERANWYESMLDSFTGTPVSATDMNLNLTFLNKPALEILGKTREEVIGKHCGKVWNVDICKDERCGIECLRHGRGKSKFSVGDRIFTTDGSYIKDLSGTRIGHVEVVADVTEEERLLAEAKNREYETQQFHDMIFDTCNVVEFSAEGVITNVNQNLLDVYGNVTRADFIGKSMASLVGEEEFHRTWDDLRRGKRHESIRRVDIGVGNVITFRQRFVPICDQSGNLLRVLEITEPE
jgi:PAS domain S-box-containing protein